MRFPYPIVLILVGGGIFSAVLVSCTASVTVTQKDDFDPSKISYFKDKRTGLCYAAITYRQIGSGFHSTTGVSMSNVPCSKEVEALL